MRRVDPRDLLLTAMDWTCGVIDRLPGWTWRVPGVHALGCPHGLGLWAHNLGERWFPAEYHSDDQASEEDACDAD